MKGFVRAFVEYVSARWRAHWGGYLSAFAPYLAASFIASAADFWSTYSFMSTDGVGDELHPAIRLLCWVIGPFWGALLGKLIQFAALVAVTVLWRPYARIIFIPVTVLYLYAAWWNLWGKDLYTPLFVKLLAW